jgi:5-dehydro-2-deoxygluconokinase
MSLSRITRNRFLVLGRCGMDFYADPPGTLIEEAERFTAALGGSAANIAAGIAKLGGTAALVSVVSNDAVGRYTVNQLRHYGVETQHVRSVGGEARNSLAVVETRNVDCQSVIYRNGAADFALSEDDVNDIPFKKYGALIVTGTALAAEPSCGAALRAIALARAAGIAVILDIDYRPYSWISDEDAATICVHAASLCDIVIGNDVEFAVMARNGDGLAFARQLARKPSKIAVYKMGDKGSITLSDRQSFETGIDTVEALKPTGAGDAFMAGFVTGLATGLDLIASVRRGTAAAAITVTRVGCAPAMPAAEELDDFIATQPVPS